MTETGVPAKPRKKFGPIAWLAVAVVVLVLGQVVSCSVQMANDPKNQPLSISDADAQRKCEAAVTKNTNNSGSVSFPSGTQIEKHDKFVNVSGHVTSRQSIETTQPYQCQVIKFDDGSVGAVETTVNRVGSK
jgi:cytoskeletal protein RodZ